MSHVIKFSGAMRPPKKLTEAELDAQIDSNRERFIAACITDKCDSGDRPCPTPDKCLLYLDTSMAGRMLRWWNALFTRGTR